MSKVFNLRRIKAMGCKNSKLDEINFDIIKDKSTEVNLYESGQIDRVGLTGDFVDKYRNSPDFKERPE